MAEPTADTWRQLVKRMFSEGVIYLSLGRPELADGSDGYKSMDLSADEDEMLRPLAAEVAPSHPSPPVVP